MRADSVSVDRASIDRLAVAARIAALCCAILAWSCEAQPVSGFRWLDAEGKEAAFSQSERWPEGKEGLFVESSAANRYTLSSPVAVPRGRAIAVDVERIEGGATVGATSPRVTLGISSEADGDPATLEASFPLIERSARFYLRPKALTRVASLYAKSVGGAGFRIVEISTPPTLAGIEEGPEGPSVSSGFRLAIGSGARELTIDSPFEGLAAGSGLLVAYGPAKGRSGQGASIVIDARSEGGGTASMSLRMGPGSGRTVLGVELFSSDAARIVARSPEGRDISAFCARQFESRDYELADLGRVLASGAPRDGEDFAIYRWDALPSVIVLVFKDYDAQDRYLKRLAFFVEKAGYRGTLQKDEVIAPLHGWNAHDYRPEDLAAFFEKARKSDFRLSSQEKALEKLLEGRGLIKEGGGTIGPGEGALISISLESVPALRRTLLVHESTHAIFFADEEYRSYVRRLWDSIGDSEKWFWKAYFAWAAYDTGSTYLMANEFQAYLLQQPLSLAREYFTKRKPDELLEKHPELSQKVEEYMKAYGASFEARARDLDGWLSRKYGFQAGKTYFLDISR